MQVPGSNLLNMALRVIAKAQFSYYAFYTRALQGNGQYLSSYSPPVALSGSAQPVPRNLYTQNGLQFDKLYYHFFVPQNVIDVQRDVSGDLMFFNGHTFQCLSITPWFAVDGWVEILAVKVQNIPLIDSILPPPSYLYTDNGQILLDESGNPIIVNQLTGPFITGQNLILTATFNQNVVVTNAGLSITTEDQQSITTENNQNILTGSGTAPFIKLSAIQGIINGNMNYISGTGTTALVFSYTVQEADTAQGLVCASPIMGAITNSSGTVPVNPSFIPPDLSGVILNA